MGVDASYLYGFMAKKEDVEWDIEYMKENFDLTKGLGGYVSDYTYSDLIEWLENDDVDDWYDIEGATGIKEGNAYDQSYLYFTHDEVIKSFPDGKLSNFDNLVKEYAKKCGVKNIEVFQWNEFGYFD